MLDFSDQPYEFFPPRPSRLFGRLARWFNHSFVLPGPNHRVVEIEVEGLSRLQELVDRGARCLFLPNHSTHSDPQVMSEVHRRLGVPSSFMAAYDVFLRSKLSAWCMQRMGSFSVDREGSDRKAMSTAIDVLKETGSLTIFPEGNVYFRNDQLTPFLEGAAFIGVKAQRDLGADEPVVAVPVAMKFTHLRDESSKVIENIGLAASLVGAEFDPEADPLEELRRIGQITLEAHLEARGFDVPDNEKSIHSALEKAAANVIGSLEADLELTPKPKETLTDRLRKIRSNIHKIRIQPDSEIDTETATAWADRAILALRMLGYTERYVAGNPTVDRFAETTEKLLEDLQSKAQKPIGPRRVIVRLCDPIDLRAHNNRAAVESVTKTVESVVQTALDEINAANQSAGSRPMKAK